MQIYKKLKELREDNEPKINQVQLASLLYTSRTQVSRWEVGSAYPSLENLKRLCEYYSVSADYLLGLPSNMPYPPER